MATILRGNIHWADLNPVIGSEQGGLRPVLILSHNVFNERSGTVIAVAITSQSQRAGYPLTMELVDTKLPKKSWVKISQIRILSTKRIGKKIAQSSDEELAHIIEGLERNNWRLTSRLRNDVQKMRASQLSVTPTNGPYTISWFVQNYFNRG